MSTEQVAKALAAALATPTVLETARRAVEDELIDWRDEGRFVLRNNGCVVKWPDGTPSDIIRFGPEIAVLVGIRAVAADLAHALDDAGLLADSAHLADDDQEDR